MSNQVFPTLAGLTWNVVRQPEFATKVQKAISGREIRLAFMSSPMMTFKLSYEVLREGNGFNEMRTLGGFFLARMGKFDSFLYSDPTDNAVTAQRFGTGNGVSDSFQLVRGFGVGSGAFLEPVMNLNGTPQIYKNDVLMESGYSINDAGLVTFEVVPDVGDVLTWTGAYYYRVRFNNDLAEFNQFMKNLFELKRVELYGSLSNKV